MFTLQAGKQHGVACSVTGDITHALNTANNGKGCSEDGTGRGVPTIAFTAKDYGADAQADLSPTLRAGGHADSHANAGVMPAICQTVAIRGREGGGTAELGGETATALRASSGGGDKPHVLTGIADTLTSHWHQSGGAVAGNNAGMINPVFHGLAVRRLTPVECERLQGFPYGHTAIPYRGKPIAADGPRYKAIGNSMAVPCMEWIGHRIEQVEAIT